MKYFKKRTIALVLASVVSVAGSFASENFKNSLLGLKFENGQNGVNMVLETKTPYNGSMSLTRRDANTYVLILREVNAGLKSPDLTKVQGSIADVDIGTLPYTTNGVGYTKITVKTIIPTEIIPQNKIYIPKESDTRPSAIEDTERAKAQQEELLRKQEELRQKLENEKKLKRETPSPNNTPKNIKTNKATETDIETNPAATKPQIDKDAHYTPPQNQDSPLMLILGALLIIAFSAYMYVRAKNKLADLTGEKINIELDDEKPNETKKDDSTAKQIKKSIKSIDKKYSNMLNSGTRRNYIDTPSVSQPIKTISSEDLNVVDLDELFQESAKTTLTEEEENLALEEFLSGFSFNEEDFENVIEEDIYIYDEAFLEKVLKRKKLKFTKDDISKLNKLLMTEITDETIRNVDKYLVSNPIKKKPTQQAILEELVTTYSVSNNITFTKDDINALNQIITVELDSDFVTDLRTNPQRTNEASEEICNSKEINRREEDIITLNVKNLLPDLTEEMKKQPAIKTSNYKPSVLDLDANCELKRFAVDLDIDFSQPQNQTHKETETKISETGWETNTLKIEDSLPDLQDALLHPEKYEKPKQEQAKADEKFLLNNLTNLSFKPFDDGSRKFEILNDLNDMEPEEEVIETLTLSEIQKELMDLGQTLEVPEPEVNPAYVAPPEKTEVAEHDYINEIKPEKTNIKPTALKTMINKSIKPNNKIKVEHNQITKCLWENQAFNVIRTVEFSNNKGCHLAKNDTGYIVLGFIGDKLFKLKEFNELKSENIQARLSETLDSGHLRYLVRIGLSKFIVDVNDDSIKHILDL